MVKTERITCKNVIHLLIYSTYLEPQMFLILICGFVPFSPSPWSECLPLRKVLPLIWEVRIVEYVPAKVWENDDTCVRIMMQLFAFFLLPPFQITCAMASSTNTCRTCTPHWWCDMWTWWRPPLHSLSTGVLSASHGNQWSKRRYSEYTSREHSGWRNTQP